MYRFFSTCRDPISSYTHFLGAVSSSIMTILMIVLSIILKSGVITAISVLLFGISLIALYSASSYYHYIPGDAKYFDLFRKLDHTMIYVLIAGTYTPIILAFMEKSRAIRFLIIIWLIAVIGIIAKLLWLNAPRILYTMLYVLMGWAIVFDFPALASIPLPCITLVALGGIAYTIGAIIYMIKKPNLSSMFGFHELFHIFIMIGSAFHIWAVIQYVIFR